MDSVKPREQVPIQGPDDGIPEPVVDRQAEAERIGGIILAAIAAGRRTIVLHGGRGSGTTELMTKWVIPRLRERGERHVWYGSCSPDFPAAFEGEVGRKSFEHAVHSPGVVVVDRFAAVLDLPRDERRAVLDRVFESREARGAGATVVLITYSRQLTSVYALTSYDPNITDAVFEVNPVGVDDGLRHLSGMQPASAVTYAEDVLLALAREAAALEEKGAPVTIELIQLVDARFRRLRAESTERLIEATDYEKVGGLEGILRGHLEAQLSQLAAEDESADEIARAILDDITDGRGEITAPDLGDMPPRLGVARTQVESVLARLSRPNGLVRQLDDGSYQLVPPQLAATIRDDLKRRAAHADRLRRLVDEAERSWSQVGNLLPPDRFLEVHRARTQLVLGREQLRFLLQCALHLENAESAGASEYWLRRVKEPQDGTDLLLAALFDQHRDVRLRAARLLGDVSGPEVRERLRVLALTDPEPEVRDQAVRALQGLSDAASLELFKREARDPNSAHRLAAIDALRVSSSDDVIHLLKELVDDPATDRPARERAIKVMATIETKAAVDALLGIALHDPDDEDRKAAAASLARIRSDDLNQHLLRSVGPATGTPRIRLARVAVALLALAGSVLLLRLADTAGAVAAVIVGVSLVLLIPTGALLRRLQDGRVQRRSVRGVLGTAFFAVNAVSLFFFFHGLAHLLIGRWRRALLLFGLELVGLLFALGVVAILDSMPGLEWLGMFYLAVGLIFFLGSYVYDIVGVLFETVLLTNTTRLVTRQAAVCREVLANPAAARLLFEALRSRDAADRERATSLLRRFATSLDCSQLIDILAAQEPASLPLAVRALTRSKGEDAVPRLEELWRTADQKLRHWIASVWCRRPTQQSLQALDSVREQLSRGMKIRLTAARLSFPLTLLPLSMWILVVLGVPATGVLLYHGYKVFTNPAWSQIVSLNLRTVPEGEMVTTVEILGEHYPEEAWGVLLDHFQDRRHAERRPAVHAALARGLITIHNAGSTPSQQRDSVRDELLAQVSRFYDDLTAQSQFAPRFRDDSLATAAPLGVLWTMAGAADSVLSKIGLQLLVTFVLLPSEDTTAAWRKVAIGALGSVRYDRALRALRMLAETEVGGGGPLQTPIRRQIDMVIDRSFIALRERDPAVDGPTLLAAIDSLPYEHSRVGEVERLVAEAVTACDRNDDRVCDERDDALALIDESPDTEHAYVRLLDYYLEREEYRDAEEALLVLKGRYPENIWPRKVLAYLYHEYLPAQDTNSFQRSYDEMAALRRLDSYAQVADTAPDYLRIEADFAEIALTARRYAELERVARALLPLTQDDVYRFNLALFLYVGHVVNSDTAAAEAALDELDEVITSLPDAFYNGWIYPGTRVFLEGSDVPAELRRAMLSLCKEGYWYSQQEAAAVIAANRAALPLLRR